MKRLVIALIVAMSVLTGVSQALAAGSCVQVGEIEKVQINGEIQRKYITFLCTGDGTITAYQFNPKSFGVWGWYLYNLSTNPGSSAPTADYDITLMVDGEDVAGGLLADRSATATQTVKLSPSTLGWHMTDQRMDVTFANQTASPSTIVLKFRFTVN